MSDRDLSIIIVNFNTTEITLECLNRLKESVNYCESILKNRIEVIVVDNGSTDDSVEKIKNHHRWVNLLESKTNLGYGGGNNLGLEESVNPYILLLNSDVYVEKDTLIKALEFFQSTPDCDVLGCRLSFQNGQLQPSGGYLPDLYNTAVWMFGFEAIPYIGEFAGPVHPKSEGFFERPRQLEWVTGAFFMMKRKVYEATRGFDPNIFMYMEEVELCMRIKQAGFRVYYNPIFSVTHLVGASSNFNVQKPLIFELKGLVYVFQKHYPNQVPILRLLVYSGCILRIIGFTLFNKPDKRQAYLEALKYV